MLNNWFKKEKPFVGFAGFGGGATGLAFGGGGGINGHSATGGIISDYEQGGETWRAHIFYAPGNFNVTELGEIDDTVEYLIVAGGGGGGANTPGGSYHGAGGGGGAGGLITNVPGVVALDLTSLTRSPQTVSAQSYPVVVGQGGAGSNGVNNTAQQNGGDSSIFGITATGGGYGSNNGTNGQDANPGGSGGGPGRENTTVANAVPNSNPTRQGYPGGSHNGLSDGRGSGGGGAGGAGGDETSATNGGVGVQVLIAGPESSGAAGYLGPNNQGGWFAGGGGGGGSGNTSPAGSGGGGGPAASPYAGGGYGANSSNDANESSGYNAKSLSGGGGGGGGSMNDNAANSWGGEGGSGVVIVRYKIGSAQTESAKATGGAISYYNGRTIHTFLTPGTFENTSGSPLGIDYVLVGGGGAGMQDIGGGGGAGGVLTNIPGMMPSTTPISDVQSGSIHALTISVGQGGQGRRSYNLKVQERNDGGDTTMSGTGINVTATGGGGASACNAPGESVDQIADAFAGRPGGSGGAGRYNRNPGAAGAGTAGQGNDGATVSGGGGGAGASGDPGGPTPNGHGGIGVQLPAIFQNPAETLGAPGPGGGGFWIAGGGGGGYYNGKGGSWDGSALIPGGPYAGAGAGGGPSGTNGLDGTGSGGGGAQGSGNDDYGGSGGSGLVLISYPT